MNIRLSPRLVVTSDAWELLRLVRNSCREGLTHDTAEITPEAQRRYMDKMMTNPLVRHYLYTYQNIVVGFSRLEWKEGYIYPTYGVASWARGQGFAWDIVKLALMAAGGPLKGDLLVTNEAIKKVDYALGFWNDGPAVQGIQRVQCPWPPPFIADVHEGKTR